MELMRLDPFLADPDSATRRKTRSAGNPTFHSFARYQRGGLKDYQIILGKLP